MSKNTTVIRDIAKCTAAEARNKHFHFEVGHFSAITKPGYPSQAKGFGCLMHSCPLFTAQTTLSGAPLHFHSLRVQRAERMKD